MADWLDERGVTRREAEVLTVLAERLTNAEIAARLYLSERTVESHVSSLLRKLGAGNRLELADLAKEHLAVTPTGVRSLPAALALLTDPDSFCGRDTERTRLRSLWDRAAGGELLVGVVAGEAGIGKSRLVAELAAEVRGDGARVLLGSCFEDVQLPYDPFVQAIRDDAAGVAAAEVRRRVGAAPGPLARMVPDLEAHVAPDLLGDVLDPMSAQAEVFGALHGYLTRAAEAGPMLLVVEDVHWATPTTRGALRHLARSSGRAPLFVLMTTRDKAPDLDDELAVFLADLARFPAVDRIDLAGLREAEVETLLRGLGGGADAAAVASETGGNPLFVREVAGRAAGNHASSLPALLARRYALLTDADTDVVDIAAVLGSEFDADVLAAATGRPLPDVLDSLERGEAAGLVAASPGRPGRFSFTHALFRNARYDALPAGRRRLLHHQVVGALERRAGDDRVLAELARHACIAAPLGDARTALGHAVRAAEAAERSLALDEAAEHYRRAIEVADLLDPPDLGARLGLSIRLGEAMQGAGIAGWRTVLLEAAGAARSMGDAVALAEVGCAMVRYGGPSNPGAIDHEFAAIMQEALHGLGPEPTAARARTLAAASEDLSFTAPEAAWAMAQEALTIARQLDDPITLGNVLLSYRISARSPDNAEARHPTADELIDLGHRTGQPAFTILGLSHRAWSFREQGELAAGNAAIDAAVALQGTHRLPPTYVVAVMLFQSARAGLAGDLEGAEAIAEGVWPLATQGFDPTNWYGPAILMIRHAQGRLAEMVPMIEIAGDQPGIGPAYRSALAAAYAHAGRIDDATAVLKEFADDRFAAIPRNFTWMASLAALAEAAEWSSDATAAECLGDLLAPLSGRLADLPQVVVAPVDLALAQLALAAGNAERAEAAASRAVAASRARNTPIFLGRELVRLAAARRKLGAQPAEVDPLVSEARDLADRTGANLIVQEAERYGL